MAQAQGTQNPFRPVKSRFKAARTTPWSHYTKFTSEREMSKNRLIVFVVGCLISLCANSAPQDGSIFSAWVGKYPSTQVKGQAGGLLAQPAIQATLKQALPEAEAKLLSLLTNESVFKEVDGHIVLNNCRPRNRPAEMATIAIDVNSKKLWVGFFTREEARVSTRWYGTGDDYSVLPKKILENFVSRHGG